MIVRAPAFAAAALLAAVSGSAKAEPSVELRHVAARVIVIPETRSDVQASIRPGDPRLPPLAVRREGDRLVIDGGLEHRIGNCGSWGGWSLFGGARRQDKVTRVEVRGVGPLLLDRLPEVTVRTPPDARIGAGDAVWGRVGPSGSLSLANSGCGDWTAGPVRGLAKIAASGSGDVRLEDAGSAEVAVAGSSDIRLGRIAQGLKASISGSGDLQAAEVNGPIATRVTGSGDIRIGDGRASSVQVSVAGSGDFTFKGEAGALSADVAGSGDVHVARVTGPVAKHIAGSGDVIVGR